MRHAESVAHITRGWVRERLSIDEVEELVRLHMVREGTSGDFQVVAGQYRDYFEPRGRPDVTSVVAEFIDYYVWEFDDRHQELELVFNVLVEAEMECERVGTAPMDSYGYEQKREVEAFQRRTLLCVAQKEFELSAIVEGDELELLEVEYDNGVHQYPYP